MKAYISAPIPFLDDAQRIGLFLVHPDIEVVSSWHDGREIGYCRTDDDLGKDASKDLREMEESDVLVMLSREGSGGGMAGELAIALFRCIPVFAIGEKLSIWSYHPWIKWFETEDELVEAVNNHASKW